MIWFLLGLTGLVSVGLGVCWWWYRRESLREAASEEILGRVVGYRSTKPGIIPRVEYRVKERSYYRNLEYALVITVSTPFESTQAELESNPLDTVITIRRNSLFSFSGMMKHYFPIGSSLRVYYHPNNPRLSYVERYVGSKDSVRATLWYIAWLYLLVIGAIGTVSLFPAVEDYILLFLFPLSFVLMGWYFYQLFITPTRKAKQRRNQ